MGVVEDLGRGCLCNWGSETLWRVRSEQEKCIYVWMRAGYQAGDIEMGKCGIIVKLGVSDGSTAVLHRSRSGLGLDNNNNKLRLLPVLSAHWCFEHSIRRVDN